MEKEYKVFSDRYNHIHKFVSINGDGNPYAFVPEQEWMPLYYTYNNDHSVAAIDTEGGPFMTVGWSNDEIVIEKIVDGEDHITRFYIKEKNGK